MYSYETKHISHSSCSILERSFIINKNKKKIKETLVWCTVNICLLCLLLYDFFSTCPLYLNYYHYIECGLIIIFSINIFYYILRLGKLYINSSDMSIAQTEQSKLLLKSSSDPSHKIATSVKSITYLSSLGSNNVLGTPMNVSELSWRSTASSGESFHFSAPSSPSYQKTTSTDISQFSPVGIGRHSPSFAKQSSPPILRFQNSLVDIIDDEDSLDQYIKDHEASEKVNKISEKSQSSFNLLSSFWSHPVAKTTKDISSFLSKSQYQLATQSLTKRLSRSPSKPEDQTSLASNISALEVWTRINVDTVALTKWNENLRRWISQTIIERLVKEFDVINDSLEKHGMTDIRVGSVGLDRLRKTSQMIQITQFIPSLTTIIPFLEVHANQDYLEKRIRELAKGGCMSEFKWNRGGSYNGKEWDDSLPTDCSVIMHLFASYLDTQLMPSPNMPDTKAFSGHYYVKATEKMAPSTPNTVYIHEVSEKPPHYRIIVGEKSYEMVKGYNNLFHSILFFIYHVNKIEQGMLGRVNLGRAGVNMLWIIGLNE
ncbi:transmembrane protein 209 [Cylas formicarius]|uniref:transmembrane protein 209 n=1 Tax=Cylas formicarius TaxID=197179 RepID=UPI0029587F7E|nr:transmembrane protein 209 [Cylas formicarius]